MGAAVDPAHLMPGLRAEDYQALRRWLHEQVGIELGPSKQTLVYSRLSTRVQALGCNDFGEYLRCLFGAAHPDERRRAIDLLTTNETYFFREPEHFTTLQAHARRVAAERGVLEVWSAASSSGEEAYTITMVLQAMVDGGLRLAYDILGSDISTRVLETGQRGVYPDARLTNLPEDLRRRYTLRGQGPAAGTSLVDKVLRDRVQWRQVNLVEPLPALGPFDVIFLRNVLIYFNRDTKEQVLRALAERLRPGGLLFVGLAEGLAGIQAGLRPVGRGVYTATHS